MLTANASKRQPSARRVRLVVEQEFASERPSQTRLAQVVPASTPRPAGRDAPVATFWRALTSGKLRVVETFTKDDRCCAVAEERTAPNGHALTERELILLHRTFQAETQKVLAAGFDLSVAAISQLLGGSLQKLGLACRVGCTPLPIVLSALSYCGVVELPSASVTGVEHDGHRYVALSLPAFEPERLLGLSSAERAVALEHVAGGTYGQIAIRRGTSPRTVANQIASLSKKLDVHGRFELIRFWADLQWGNAGRS